MEDMLESFFKKVFKPKEYPEREGVIIEPCSDKVGFIAPATTIQGKPIGGEDGKDTIRVFRYASDIHLEMRRPGSLDSMEKLRGIYQFEKKENHRYFLSIVGDIGSPIHQAENLIQFLKRCSDVYEHVFFVMGNHEYYTRTKTTMESIHQGLKDICNLYTNVHLLENQSFQLDEYKVLGTTLWSDVSSKSEYNIQRGLNDYNLINIKDSNNPHSDQDGSRKLNVQDTNTLHKIAMNFLTKEIVTNNTDNTPCIVLTHHAPQFNDHKNKTFTSHPKFERDDPIGEAFSTDLSLFLKPPILVWIYGHTHYSSQYKYDGVSIISNQLGYEFGEDLQEASFDSDAHFIL